MRRSFVFRIILGTVLPLVGVLAGPGLMPVAHAELGACYSDPVVVLSNGMSLDLSDTISDTYTDVQQVAYTIHAPAGITVVSVTYTSGPIGPKETFRFSSNGATGQYGISSAVTTGGSSIQVDASAVAVSITGASSDSATGWNDQQIRLTLPT